jgi:ornithine decarboxylase
MGVDGMHDHQTPFFLFDLEKVKSRYRRLSEAFPGAAMYYAVKANNHSEVLKTLISCGSKFDIGSKHEAEILLDLGVAPDQMIFSAPVKLQSHIRDTHEMGIRHYVFDSENELAKLAMLAPGSDVMVRLAVDNKGSFFPLSMKFGAPPEQSASLLRAAGDMGLVPYGIAFHVGSQCVCKQTWRRAMESAAEVAAALQRDGIECRALDIGGGFPIKYSEDVPPIEEIAEEIYEVFNSRFAAQTELIVEPGRCLVGESAVLAATVIGRARRADEDWLFLDASAFHGLLEAQQVKGRFPYPVKVNHNGHEKRKYVLSGPTCDPDDTILAEVWLPETRVGDKLYILNTGAYSFVYATNFHGFAPPDIHFISKGESLDTLWSDRQPAEGYKPEFDEEKRYVYEHQGQVGVVYFAIRTVPNKWLEPLWKIYNESLHSDEAIQEQSCYDHDSFISALTDPEYIKGLLVVDDEPVGLMMGALTLEKAAVAYINPAYIRKQFPKEVEEGRFCYITTFFISSRLRNLGFVKLMCGALFTAVHDKNLLLGGDVTDNRLYIPDLIEKISEEIGFPIKKRLLGTQTYFAFECLPATGTPMSDGISDVISQVQS